MENRSQCSGLCWVEIVDAHRPGSSNDHEQSGERRRFATLCRPPSIRPNCGNIRLFPRYIPISKANLEYLIGIRSLRNYPLSDATFSNRNEDVDASISQSRLAKVTKIQNGFELKILLRFEPAVPNTWPFAKHATLHFDLIIFFLFAHLFMLIVLTFHLNPNEPYHRYQPVKTIYL